MNPHAVNPHAVNPHAGKLGVVAHRGASAELPEHTLAAYERALLQGADALECDVRLTRDGHLVCVHDRRVDRTSTGAGIVSEMTLQGMARLDYGRWHSSSRASAEHPVADPGRRERHEPAAGQGLLTLTQLLDLVTAHPGRVRLFVETKHPVRYGGLVEAKVLAELHRFGLARPADPVEATVLVMSFSASAVWRVRRSAPRLPTVLLGRSAASLALVSGTSAIGPQIDLIRSDPHLVERARAQGRDTYTWTVDGEDDIELCRQLGVRWVATNRPHEVRGWLAAVPR